MSRVFTIPPERPESVLQKLEHDRGEKEIRRALYGTGLRRGEAIDLLIDANNSGSELAGFFLGEVFIYGLHGQKQDFDQAKRYLEVSYARGTLEAGYYLFKIAHWSKSYDTALKILMDLSCDRYPPAFMLLGIYYLKGNGVEADKEAALQFFKKGEELGHLHSAHWVSHLMMKQGITSHHFWVGLFKRIMIAPSFIYHYRRHRFGRRFYS